MSVKVAYKTESGNNDRGLGTGRPELSVTGILSKTFDRMRYHVNLGCTEKHEVEDALTYNFAAEYAYTDKTRLAAEVFGDTVLSGKFDDNATSLQLGVRHDLSDAVMWDAGWTLGLSKADPDFKVTTGLTVVF